MLPCRVVNTYNLWSKYSIKDKMRGKYTEMVALYSLCVKWEKLTVKRLWKVKDVHHIL